MSSLTGVTRRSGTLAALCLGIAGCAPFTPRSASSAPAVQALSKTERIAHVLSRLTFGARSGDAERVAALGIDRWIDQQLDPQTILASAVVIALASVPAWN